MRTRANKLALDRTAQPARDRRYAGAAVSILRVVKVVSAALETYPAHRPLDSWMAREAIDRERAPAFL